MPNIISTTLYTITLETGEVLNYDMGLWPDRTPGDPYRKSEVYWDWITTSTGEVRIKDEGKLANDLYKERIEHLKNYISTLWMQTDKTPAEIRARFKLVKETMKTATTRSAVRQAVSNFKSWMVIDSD